MNPFHVSPENCILLKFVPSQYADDICNGKLYCNNVNFFRHLPTGGGQGDDMECTAYHYLDPDRRTKIQLDGFSNFLFCLYALPPMYVRGNRGYYRLPPKARKKFIRYFDDAYNVDCIYIPEPDKYISKILQVCQAQNISVAPSMVSYLDTHKQMPNTRNRILNWLEDIVITKSQASCVAFIKRKEYSWQQEFRFLFYNVPEEKTRPVTRAFVLDIGNVDGIVHRVEHCFSPFL